LLTNVVYIGQVRYKDEVHDGEHPAIVDPTVFRRVQETLRAGGNGADYGATGALLQGLLRCKPCERAMTPSYTQKGAKRYRYYVCTNAHQRGYDHCPARTVPAGSIERIVVEQVRAIGRDPALLAEVLGQLHTQQDARTRELEGERRTLEKDLAAGHGELRKLSGQIRPNEDNGPVVARLADLHRQVETVEARVQRVRNQLTEVRKQWIDAQDASTALAAFDPVWQALAPREQARVVRLLVERVDYDGVGGKVNIAFRPSGLRTLAEELRDEPPAIAGRIA
jgi:site-specific DNA recombinase